LQLQVFSHQIYLFNHFQNFQQPFFFIFSPLDIGCKTFWPSHPRRRLAALRERRARIDAEIEQLEAQLDEQERAGQKGAEVLEVESARGGGSYVLQKVRCGKPTCRCARAGGELHGRTGIGTEEGREDEEQVCWKGEPAEG